MAVRRRRTPSPMETPGFGWRVSISILVVFGWVVFLILWLMLYAGAFNVYQNLAIIFVSIIIAIAILAASWASWGIKYGYKYGNEWSHYEKR